jgi:hypothetical protein
MFGHPPLMQWSSEPGTFSGKDKYISVCINMCNIRIYKYVYIYINIRIYDLYIYT